MKFKRRKTILGILLIIIVSAVFILVKSYVLTRVGNSIHNKLSSLKISGFHVKYDSIVIDWRKNRVMIDHLVLEKNAYDTTCVYPEFISIGKIRADGFSLLPLIFKNTLRFESVHLEKPHFICREKSRFLVDSATQRENEFTLRIDEVFIDSAQIEYTDSVNCELIAGFQSHVSLSAVKMDFHIRAPFVFTMNLMTLDSTQIRLPRQSYSFRIKQTRINFSKRSLQLDTIGIIPDFGKLEFGRKYGYEVDRFDGIIPFIKLSGWSFSMEDSTVFRCKLADVQFYLKVFRDKRLPFKSKAKPLPLVKLQNLPFSMFIDSLKITKSFVQYEELLPDAEDPGKIYFDDLSGAFVNVDNRSHSGNMRLTAQASFMGQGDIRLSGTFPLNKGKKAKLAGSIENFSIPKINSMLTPATNIKVETGDLNKLSFNFHYNNTQSTGEIELNYNNLKLVTYKDDDKNKETDGKPKHDDPQKDNLKSFILNTFIFRKNMDENVPEDKRTGTIQFIRDDSRSIFNFWVKSILSGVKSAYNLDKPLARKNIRDGKKEERLTKREAKKIKKAEKRKERG